MKKVKKNKIFGEHSKTSLINENLAYKEKRRVVFEKECQQLIICHCVKSVQIRSFFWCVVSCIRTEYGEILSSQSEYRKIQTRKNSVFGHYLSVFSPNTGKYRPEKTPYLDTFQTVHDVPEGLRYHPKSRAVVSQ